MTGSLSSPANVVMGGLVGKNGGIISNSYNSATVTAPGTSAFIGGLVSQNFANSKIISSYNSGAVTSTLNSAGGLANYNLGSITDSFNLGAVTAKIGAGGITANNRSKATISNSYSTGAITANGQAGGLVGYNFSTAQINNSYATGTVTNPGIAVSGGIATGGLVGDNRGAIANSYATGAVNGNLAVGGVVGTMSMAGTLTNVYSSGAVALVNGGMGTVGGVVGTMSGTSSVNSGYFNATLNPAQMTGVGLNNSSNSQPITSVIGLSSAQMQVASNFANFAFTTDTGVAGNNWVMVNTDGTLNGAGNKTGATWPMLSAEYSTNIYSSHQLQLMAMNLAGNYTLKQDINAASTGTTGDVWNGATFVPLGASTATPFTGTLNGAGHVISGLVINRPGTNVAGLFGATSGTAIVRDIGLEGGSITGKDATGALVGSNLGLVSGSYSTASVTGGSQVGGLVGLNGIEGGTPGIVTNSYASGAVTGTGIIGGLVGENSGTLTNHYASGTVTGGSSAGGLAGSNSSTATVTGNFWDSTTSGQLNSATGAGLSTAQMKLLSTYSGAAWDLAGAWIVYDSYTYPLLRAFMTPLQVTFAANASKTYDGTNVWTAPGVSSSNAYGYAALQGTLNYGAAGNAVNAGTYAITASGLYSGQRGYAITANSTTLTIDKRALTLTGLAGVSKQYDGLTSVTLTGGTLLGLVGSEVVTVGASSGSYANANAGSGKAITVVPGTLGDGNGLASNYSLAAPTGVTGAITTKLLTWSGLTAANKVYDGTKAATITGGSLNGMVGSETVTWVPSGLFSDSNAANGKTVTVSTVLGDGSNGGLAAWRPTTGSPIRSRRPTSRKKC